jgi:alpha-L-rhamnosidase
MYLDQLRIEYQKNPIGIDCRKPRFSWKLISEKQNVMQTAYQIIVRNQNDIVWNTGKVNEDTSIHIRYEGEPLKAVTRYNVSVDVWDNQGDAGHIEGEFETGLFGGNNFKANWITHTLEETEACPVFVKEFEITKTIEKARLYASSLGIYELELNGIRVGEDLFTPGWTSYHNRLQYQTYDITNMLLGNNILNMTVANGWYKGVFGFSGTKNNYGDRLAVIAEVRLTYTDGSEEVFGTDTSWKCKTGVILFSEIYDGEIVDANYIDMNLKPTQSYEYKKEILLGQENTPVRITTRFKPINIIKTPKNEIVLDFGQNMAGFVEMKLNCHKGTKVILKHAEVLDKDGNFYTENLRSAKATDEYICKGGEELYHPHFTFHGFRYLCVEGLGEEINPNNFTACSVHTDMEQTGTFECSNPWINRLQKNIEWGQRSNFLDIPTDCPQRDERLGWTGDAQVFARTAAFNMNVALFFAKWLKDLKADQTMEYGVPSVIPNILGNQAGAAAWGDAATIIPWTIYLVYGDKSILEEQYNSMRAWVEYIYSVSEKGLLWQSGFQYADWLALDKEEMSDRIGATDKYFVATAFYAYSTEILYKSAQILGYEEDYKKYSLLYLKIVDAFNDEYITKTGRLVSETQTGCVLALHFNLARVEFKDRIVKTLEKNLAAHKNHLVTGFVGTPYISHVLSDYGLHEIAGKLILQEDFPSWLYAVKKGATTIWERWNSMLADGSFDESGMNSFNHYAYGSIGDWLYQKVAGIQLIEPGYKKIKIAPKFVKGITFAKATFDSMYGLIASSWVCENGRIIIDVTIPANTTAILELPEWNDTIEVGSGSYHYEYDTALDLRISKYSMESTLGQILENPLAVDMLEQFAPGTTTNPMVKLAYGQTIAELTSMMPAGGDQMFITVIDALNNSDK